MSTQVILKPTVDQGTTTTSQEFDSSQCDMFAVMADALGPGETVDIYVMAGYASGSGFGQTGGTPVVVANADGSPAQLTDTAPVLPLEGGPRYIFVKSTTGAPCGIYISVKEHT